MNRFIFVGVVLIILVTCIFVFVVPVVAEPEPCSEFDLTPENFLRAGEFVKAKGRQDYDTGLRLYLNEFTDGEKCLVENYVVFVGGVE